MKRQSRKSGIEIIGDVPWGTHICQFYQTKEDLMEISVTYFKAGLENNEFCFWVTSQPVGVEDAKEALRKAIPDFDTYLEKGQIEIITYTDWFIKEGVFDSKRVSNSRFEKLNHALDSGYDGMRLSGNTTWLEKENWNCFIEFKEQTDKAMDTFRMINLCTYLLDRHNAAEIIDIVVNHQFALIKSEGKWKCIESPKRKQAEEALREGEERLRFALETSHIGAWDLDLVDHTAYRSLEHDRIFGYEQLLPQWTYEMFLDHVLPEDRMMVNAKFLEAMTMLSNWNFECRIRRVDGAVRWIWAAGRHSVNATGSVRRMAGIVQDITERKQAGEALLESEKRYRTLFDHSMDAIVLTDPSVDGKILSVNPAACRMLGWSEEELIGKGCDVMFDLQDPALSTLLDERALSGSARAQLIYRRKDGTTFPGEVSTASFTDSNGEPRTVAIIRDVTERKKAEDALRESEKRERANSGELAAVLDAVPVAVYISHDPQVLQITGNRLSYEWLRIPVGTNLSKSALEGERPEMFKLFKDGVEIPPIDMPSQMAAAGIEINDCELDIVSADGEIRHVLGNARPLRDEQGNLRGSISAFIDITGRKKAEEALKQANDNLENSVKERTAELERAYKSLKESEKGLAEAQKMAYIGNWDWNIVTNEIYCSDEVYRIFGFDPQEISATYGTFLSYVHPDDLSQINYASIEDLIGRPNSIDFRIILANGEERTVHAQTEVIFAEEKNPVRIKGIIQDITERKKAEKALELSEERYRIITEQTGQLVYDYDVEKDTANWAGDIRELTGFTPGDFKSMSLGFWLSRIHPEDQNILLEKYGKSLVSGDAYRMEYRFRKKNGEYIHFEDNGIFQRDKKGNSNRVLGVVKDITERKKAEIFVANIETARKKEIHHRIKNNLQVISSLLDLQAEKFRDREYIEDSEVLKAFRESQDRVTSIALIHEELHEGKGTDTLDFSPYLERLVKNLFQTYRLGNASTGLNIELEENIFFDMDIAVPLGIIINELVSNSLKYAFTDKDKGEIQIKLYREKSPECAGSGLGNGPDSRLSNGPDSRLSNGPDSRLGNGPNSVPERRKEGRDDTNFILTVSDDGIGISENSNSESSSSLGLQLVMILVDQLGGELELKRDSGTEFVIRFTVAEKQ